jgi:hypothetical protein
MGACFYSNLEVVKGDVNDAYNVAYEEARDCNGHQEGYSGDIQTANGLMKPKGKVPRFGTKAFQKWEDKTYETMDKGDCIAIELKGAVLKRLKERRGLKARKGYRAFYFFGCGRC